ncbi:WxL domain-containing protein [Lapidilactobacillus luobeiensis]|uniref:WxL domain-containing protein n=1 Tax=Lapidilactobacillus luobeiensis TaxID=2950371 RepID=UPI0021C30BDA|nr:WxL domain-containing protein [Lapidilactobacillus luobeiensis]
MKANKFIVWASALLSGLLLATTATVHADIAADGQSGTSTARVGLYLDSTAAIKLIQVPDYDFNAQQLSATGETYHASNVGGSLVVENPGIPNGWSVKVRASTFKTADQIPLTLKGASLALAAGTITPNETVSRAPGSYPVTVNSQDALIMSAPASSGIGVFKLDHTVDQVALSIPAGNLAGDYTAVLTWTLESSPDQ